MSVSLHTQILTGCNFWFKHAEHIKLGRWIDFLALFKNTKKSKSINLHIMPNFLGQKGSRTYFAKNSNAHNFWCKYGIELKFGTLKHHPNNYHEPKLWLHTMTSSSWKWAPTISRHVGNLWRHKNLKFCRWAYIVQMHLCAKFGIHTTPGTSFPWWVSKSPVRDCRTANFSPTAGPFWAITSDHR